MLYVLYGEDTYRSRKKLHEIVESFQKKNSEEFSVRWVDAEDEPEAATEIGRTVSLFAKKELVVVTRLSQADDRIFEHIADRAKNLADDTELTVIFWEPALDAADKKVMAPFVKAATKAQEFSLLEGAKLEQWILAEAQSRGFRIGARAAASLAEMHGGDLWAISNEIEKMMSGWAPEFEKTEEEKIWTLGDEFTSANRRRAFRPLIRLLGAGMEAIQLLGAIASSVRQLGLVFRANEAGSKTMLKGMHPYVISKTMPKAMSFGERGILRAFDDLVAADRAAKTGELRGDFSLLRLVLKKQKRAA